MVGIVRYDIPQGDWITTDELINLLHKKFPKLVFTLEDIVDAATNAYRNDGASFFTLDCAGGVGWIRSNVKSRNARPALARKKRS